jgi:hypothetical protein
MERGGGFVDELILGALRVAFETTHAAQRRPSQVAAGTLNVQGNIGPSQMASSSNTVFALVVRFC